MPDPVIVSPEPVIISPTLTLAGQARAFAASNDGVELKISHVSYGVAHYDPTGNEVALTSPVGNKVPVAGAARPTPYQIRMISSWREDVGDIDIGEIAFWAGDVLVFVWSKADGTILSRKTNGVSYVLFCDLSFASAPANSISFVIDPQESIALAALAVHESALHAHPQYIIRSKFPDYQGYLWGITSGTADAIQLTLPAIVDLAEYSQGNRFTFKALFDNTGNTSIEVNSAGPVQVLKTGGVPLTAGSIIKGGVYDVLYDGGSFQLTAGAGFASAEATTAEVTTGTSVNSTNWISVRRLIQALALKANLSSPALTGLPTAPTAQPGTNTKQLGTTEFIQAAIAALVDSSPATLNTLKKLATALGNDPNFATTMSNLLALKAPLASPVLTGNPTTPTPAVGDNDLSIANTAFVHAAIASLVDSSPAALDTLKELAEALGNDPHFATTITNLLSLKAPLESPSFTGTVNSLGPIVSKGAIEGKTLSSEGNLYAGLSTFHSHADITGTQWGGSLSSYLTTEFGKKFDKTGGRVEGSVTADGNIVAEGSMSSAGDISVGDSTLATDGDVSGIQWGGWLSDYLTATFQLALGFVPVRQLSVHNSLFGWDGANFLAKLAGGEATSIWTDANGTARAILAQASGAAGAVGTYGLMTNRSGVALGPGETVAGQHLTFTNVEDNSPNGGGTTGTWRCMGYSKANINYQANINDQATTLFLRIA